MRAKTGLSLLRFITGALCALMAWGAAAAETDWPSRPITFIVPYAAGGFADTRMRQLTQALSKDLGVSIVVENRAGAGGVIGTTQIARAKPDGYTIGSGHLAPLSVNPMLMPRSVNYDVATDIVPVVLVEESPLILNVNQQLPAKTLQELIDYAKQRPGQVSFGSSGVGGAHHLSGELFAREAGLSLNHVPYKGGSPAATDLMAGHIQMMFEMGYAAMPAIESGKARPLAVTSLKRLPLLPDVPTLDEAGVKGFESYNWQGVIAPKGTPPAIVEKLNAAFNKVLKDPEVLKAFDATGGQAVGGTPQEFADFIAAETRKWGALIQETGIKPE